MEKLQAALDKARGERQRRISPRDGFESGSAPVRNQANGGSGAIVARWASLPDFTPDPGHLTRNRIMTLLPSAEAMPFDMLRTKLLIMMKENKWTRVAITSPEQGCGKSTLACNLAFALNRQRETRTMLLDLDLRRPSVSRIIGAHTNQSLEGVFSGGIEAEDQMVNIGGNLALVLSGASVSDPMKTITNQGMPRTLDKLQADYAPDVMIFDLSPMLAVDDTRAILREMDCAIIVARAEQTSTARLDQCEREVAEYTNVLGVVLNSCRYGAEDQDYY